MHLARAVGVIAALVVVTPSARADGVYVSEAFGVSLPRGAIAPCLAQPLKVRLAAGVKYRWVAIEPFISADMQLDRVGALRGFVGGKPAAGTSDLSSYGIDAKVTRRIDRVLSAYVRVGPSRVDANGALAGYAGWGAGASAGLVISGRVRALGFLWAPLFFVKRGPMVTGALFLDQGVDVYRLRMAGAPNLDARVGHVCVGFALGSDF